MARVEINDSSLVVTMEDDGVQGVLLEGVLRFDPLPNGVGVVLDMKTTQDSEWTPVLRSMVARVMLDQPVSVRHEGVEIQLSSKCKSRSVKTLKQLPRLRSTTERAAGGLRLVQP